ncbi:uncharacterized protein LOC117294509 [Asterias rubens]|uniref:uncharacterized protein LOC117294509 n=1 Tax=Asterias rubens TaxID=7604 RepID=UPI001454E485|nr:uncharacterized protein LOC117294509 [Asterias rubens]
MSTDNKENAECDKKKKNRPRLSIKIFSGGSKKKDLRKIHEEHHDSDGSHKAPEESPEVLTEEKNTKEIKTDNVTESDVREESAPVPVPLRFGRRRSLSACADVQDTRIKRKDDSEGGDQDETDGDQLSPLPASPTRSCIRGRSATFSHGENVEERSRQRSVSFSPETVDPPPRNLKYREWIEAKTKAPPINVKHEKHKQKMNQMKKVNLSDFLSSPKRGTGGIMSVSTSAFGGGGSMMM